MDERIGHGISHPNLALIKYWGKKDEELNIPSNMSISVQLSKFETKTVVKYSDKDEFYLNEKKIEPKKRMLMMIKKFQDKANDYKCISISSFNNFPDSCGLASSASGFSALAIALNDFYKTNLTDKELTEYAGYGSRSASRSIYSGIVVNNYAYSEHFCDWNELKVFSIIISGKPKKVGSTVGMIRTANTSFLYKARLTNVDNKVEEMKSFFKNRDFKNIAIMTMKDCNETHAVMLDSFPPIRYINDDGFEVIEKCHEFNNEEVKVAYTFDAGPNPFIITLEKYVNEVKSYFSDYELIPCN